MLKIALVVVHVLVSLVLMLLILMHSGRGAGLSDVFGGGVSQMGGGQIERQLDRITVVSAILFAVTTILLGLSLSS